MIPYFLHVHTEHHIPTGIPDALLDALTESIGICALVILMMTLIEIFNVVTKGRLFRGLENHRFAQICASSALGFIPGCLGGFAGVSLYSHRMVGFGALMATLVATTGDEAFIMLASFPGDALKMMLGLCVLGIAVGYATDIFIRSMQKRGKLLNVGSDRQCDDNYELHACDCEEHHHDHHEHGGHEEGAVHSRIIHFVHEHVWRHVIKRHLPTIFAWTFGVLALFGILSIYIDVETWIRGNVWIMILLAVLMGLIPESGPHLIFVTMYASGILPFSVLLANCIAQDGHACLPLIAENPKSWLTAKLLKSVLALAAGFLSMIIA